MIYAPINLFSNIFLANSVEVNQGLTSLVGLQGAS